jgi:hypothetical protein
MYSSGTGPVAQLLSNRLHADPSNVSLEGPFSKLLFLFAFQIAATLLAVQHRPFREGGLHRPIFCSALPCPALPS